MRLALLEVQARSNHDAGDLPLGEVDGAQPIAGAPVVGRVVARRDLGGSSVYDRPVQRREDEETHRTEARSEAFGQSRGWAQPLLDQIAGAAHWRGSQIVDRMSIATEQDHLVGAGVVAVGADDGEACLPAIHLTNSG
jgi:hypothetical protein